jgi:GNAT superfamily N-acetyltransferase
LSSPKTLVRTAVSRETDALSRLTMRSKAHWGYDATFLEACRAELTVTPQMIAEGGVRVAETNSVLQGIYRLTVSGRDATIELFYIDPSTIGSGIGRQLWGDLVARAIEAGATKLLIEADPHAEGFYERMGAVRTGSCPSGSIHGRMLPLLELTLGDTP